MAAAGGADPATVLADLSSLAEVRTLPGQIAELTDRVDVLVNNAGVGPGDRHGPRRPLTVDGNELCFAVNYLAAFDLTHRLLPDDQHRRRSDRQRRLPRPVADPVR